MILMRYKVRRHIYWLNDFDARIETKLSLAESFEDAASRWRLIPEDLELFEIDLKPVNNFRPAMQKLIDAEAKAEAIAKAAERLRRAEEELERLKRGLP